MFKASIAKRDEKEEGDNDDGSDWESVEEDAPVIRLEELLDNMKIATGDNDSESEGEEDNE